MSHPPSRQVRMLESAIGKVMDNDPEVTALDFSNQMLGDEECEKLSEALKNNNLLKELYLRNCSMGERGMEALSDALISNYTLHTLDVSHNRIGNQGLCRLSKAMQSNQTVIVLDISYNYISLTKEDYIFSEMISRTKSLTVLEQSKNPMSYSMVQEFADALEQNKTLKNLGLSQCGLMDRGAARIVETTQVNHTLMSLSLDDNDIGKQGTCDIGKTLQSENNALISLILSNNRIDDEGMHDLAEGLKNNKKLLSLNLNNNRISDVGMRSLSEALIKNETLQVLELASNQITEAGLSWLLRALTMNEKKGLKRMTLKHNKISPLFRRELNHVPNWMSDFC